MIITSNTGVMISTDRGTGTGACCMNSTAETVRAPITAAPMMRCRSGRLAKRQMPR